MFGKEDFTPENAQRLSVIISSRMGNPPLTSFRELIPTQKKKFNRLLNEYIQALPEDWMPKLLNDFDQIVNEDILHEEFDPSKMNVVDGYRELLLTEQQRKDYESGELKLSKEYEEIVVK